MARRTRALLIIPAAGIGLIALVLALRPPASPTARLAVPGAPPPDPTPASAVAPSATPEPPKPSPASPPLDPSRAAELKLVLDHYRQALRDYDTVKQEALLPALRRERENAIKMTQEEFQRAATPSEKDLLQRVLQTLRELK